MTDFQTAVLAQLEVLQVVALVVGVVLLIVLGVGLVRLFW